MKAPKRIRSSLACTTLAGALMALASGHAAATNGMNLEAYGSKAGGMGGASFAFENGNSAIMNNPATLGLRQEGNNLGLGLTLLQPDVNTRMNSPMGGTLNARSEGDAYWMPSLSLIRKSGRLTYGVGMLAQGGMGTEYGSNSFLSNGTGLPLRSEVGFGRLMMPLAFNVNEDVTVAGQLDYVWASMDVQMLMSDGSGHVNFSNDNDFSGQASGNGWAFKLGAHYKVSSALAFGVTYHSKTDIGDLEGNGTFTMLPGGMQMPTQFKVEDFQWPETYGVGVAWQATPAFLLAADVKRLGWSDSMKDFRLGMNMGMGWQVGAMPQNWKDQTVFMLGGQYMLAPGVALRVGINHAENPVPDDTLNPLFPAIVKTHYTLGLGWNMGGGHSVAGSIAIAPKVTRTNPNMFGPGMAGTVSHSQRLLRLNYNYSF
jgi:long-chain fatty acid transport protein